ncbi:PREDICTED: probable G-protein coupled receptor 113 [Elephantulus edwardii]|uniref:probable G-protein coupled receptor 113 n=1 Tax=Elephantulus edwardii TaxID=28737 RepID=UPI0003F0C582|nr:PREDICTED: probable G-protein coupled receptor 113 [Elephantulus edwardii]
MVTSAAPLLLLAMTLPLLGSPSVPASQPGEGQAGGESEKQMQQDNGASGSVQIAVYVSLDFVNKAWPPELSSTLAKPSALSSSSSRALSGLSLTTECDAKQDGHFHCGCLPGYQWNANICSHHSLCPHSYKGPPCACLIFNHPEPVYCQLLPPGFQKEERASPATSCLSAVPGKLSLDSTLPTPASTLQLTLRTHQAATGLHWSLQAIGSPVPINLWPGTQVSLDASSQGQAALSISNLSQDWAGEYTCHFEAQGFWWELHQEVRVPLQEADVALLPDKLSVSCAASSGFQLSCCFPGTHPPYKASWSPDEGSTVSLLNKLGSQCLVLTVPSCPPADTEYTCELQSPELDTVRVSISVTLIQGGDNFCPENSLDIRWNVTKAGFVAQAPCPVDRIGMITRSCGPDGAWGPVNNTCTDARLLDLLRRARLLQAGQHLPAEEVPQLLEEFPEQVTRVSSPSDLLTLLDTMTVLANVVDEANIELGQSPLKALLNTTDRILDLGNSSLWAPAQAQLPLASSHLLLAVETLASRLRPQDHPFSCTLPSVQLQTQLLGDTLATNYNASFSTQPPLWVQVPRHSLVPLVHSKATVSITSLLLKKLDHLLPSNYAQGLGDSLRVTPGLVLSVSIMAGGQAFKKGEVIMDFGNRDGTPHCVFWDHGLFHGEGGWSDEGCQAQAAKADSTTQCVCQHLTAFSILMSRHTVPKSPVLVLLTQLGLGASIAALLVCLAVYRLVWRVVVRNKVAYFRHAALLNVVLCLLAADTCFLGSPLLPQGPHSPLCLATAFLCHFLYLATFFWMLAQALMLAHQLLFVFHQLSKHWVLPLMVALGYLCPLGFAGCTLGLYLPQGQYLGEGNCWLDGKRGALYMFAGPVLVIVGVNGLVVAMAVLKLLRPSLSEGPQVEKRQALVGVIKALLVLTPIYGLTWGFGLATLIDEVSEVSHYIFIVLNTSQGVFILLFGCLMDKKVQEALRKRFCRTLPSSSTISLATNETSMLEQSKEEVKMSDTKQV